MTMPRLETDFSVRVCASLDGLTSEMRADRQRKAMLAAEIAYLPAQAAQFSSLPYEMRQAGYGPKPGYNWAVQAIAVEGLGTSDYLNLYKGQTAAADVAGYGRWTFTVSVAGAIAAWHPGRTGLVLRGASRDSIVFNGSIAGTVTVNSDVIQLTDEQMPYFLL